jgi:hypothetical protein
VAQYVEVLARQRYATFGYVAARDRGSAARHRRSAARYRRSVARHSRKRGAA